MVGSWKVLNKSSPGSGTEFGADDTDKINKLLRGDLNIDTVEINSDFRFRDNKLLIRDPLNLNHYIVRTSGIIANRQATLPMLTADDTFTFNDHASTLTNKILAGARISNYYDVESTSTPGNPGANVLRVYRRTSDNALVYRNNTGTETVLGGAGGGSGEVNTASNIGTAGANVFKSKVGVDLQFRKINGLTGGLVTVVEDTPNNKVDVKLEPAGTSGHYIRTVGTTTVWDRPGIVMPDGSNYTGRKWGRFMGGAVDGDGLFSGLYTTGTLSSSTGTSVTRTLFKSAATDLAFGGWSSWLRCVRGSFLPRLKISMAPTDRNTERNWIGFVNQDTFPSSASPLDSNHGVLIGYNETDTNWMVRWNNGSVTPQSASTGIAKDQGTYRTAEIVLTDTTVSATYNTLVVNASTVQVPTSTMNLMVYCMGQSVGTDGAGMGVQHAMLTFDNLDLS